MQFASKGHAEQALEKNKESIGHRLVFQKAAGAKTQTIKGWAAISHSGKR